MLTTLLLLAAAAAQPLPIGTFDQVRELCGSLRASEAPSGRLYSVEVPSKGFTWGRFRAADNEIELDGDRPLRAADGTLLLDLQQTDAVAFRVPEGQVEEWKRAKDAGELSLQIVFEPSADGCSGSVHARQLRLAGSARSWRLARGGKVLAAADEEGKPLRPDGPRVARVQSVSLEGEAPREDDGRGRLAHQQGALDACVKRASATGPVVISFSAKGGALQDVQVAMDGLHDEEVSGCLARALSGTTLRGVGSGKGTATIAVE